MATSTLGDGVEMRIDDEIDPKVDDVEIRKSRTILFKYMDGQIEICLIPHTELSRFGLDHSTKVFCGTENPIGKIKSHLSAHDSDREVICFIENMEKTDEFILFSYNAGKLVLMRHAEGGTEHEIFKHNNVFEIDLIDKNAQTHGHDTPKSCL
jgi:hypothetical protein